MTRPLVLTLVILFPVLTVVLLWYAASLLDGAILVLRGSGGEREIIRGWSIVLALWPLVLTGAVPVLVIAAGSAIRLLSAALSSDQQREMQRCRNEVENATARADQAESDARTRYEKRVADALKMQREATLRMFTADARVQEAEATIAAARKEVDDIRSDAEVDIWDAERRLQNAISTTRRLRKKVAQLEGQKASNDK